jgi:hypothetical protein
VVRARPARVLDRRVRKAHRFERQHARACARCRRPSGSCGRARSSRSRGRPRCTGSACPRCAAPRSCHGTRRNGAAPAGTNTRAASPGAATSPPAI